jgi:hypothetical protein
MGTCQAVHVLAGRALLISSEADVSNLLHLKEGTACVLNSFFRQLEFAAIYTSDPSSYTRPERR